MLWHALVDEEKKPIFERISCVVFEIDPSFEIETLNRKEEEDEKKKKEKNVQFDSVEIKIKDQTCKTIRMKSNLFDSFSLSFFLILFFFFFFFSLLINSKTLCSYFTRNHPSLYIYIYI